MSKFADGIAFCVWRDEIGDEVVALLTVCPAHLFK